MKTVLVVFMVMNMRQAREDMENIVMEMRMELNAVNKCLAKTEENLMETREELRKVKEELKSKSVQLEEHIKMTKEDQKNTNEGLFNNMDALKTKDLQLDREVSFLREPPFFHACGSILDLQSFTTTPPQMSMGEALIYLTECLAPLIQEHILSHGV